MSKRGPYLLFAAIVSAMIFGTVLNYQRLNSHLNRLERMQDSFDKCFEAHEEISKLGLIPEELLGKNDSGVGKASIEKAIREYQLSTSNDQAGFQEENLGDTSFRLVRNHYKFVQAIRIEQVLQLIDKLKTRFGLQLKIDGLTLEKPSDDVPTTEERENWRAGLTLSWIEKINKSRN